MCKVDAHQSFAKDLVFNDLILCHFFSNQIDTEVKVYFPHILSWLNYADCAPRITAHIKQLCTENHMIKTNDHILLNPNV